MSSKSNISLCSDTLGHLLWECWWLKLVHQAPCHYWILHETPWPTCRSRISNIPLQRRPWPSHLTSFSQASSIQCIILTNLTFKLKWYQEHESYIPSLSSLNFSQHSISSIRQCCMSNSFTVLSCFCLSWTFWHEAHLWHLHGTSWGL